MLAADIREMSIDELESKLEEYKKEVFNLRFQLATAQLSNTQRIKDVKRNIARILTIIKEKQMENVHE